MNAKKTKVFVAMSGGVDSSVAALLLQKSGYDVTGVHMICYGDCGNNQDKQDAMRVAAHLNISLLTWDFRKEYREAVFNYMVSGYRQGLTPNPDVMCNKEIKFGIFLNRALKEGADFIATGHYARLERAAGTRIRLLAAKDASKDQSYFLWTLTQKELGYSLFPVGEYQKSEIRKIARLDGIPVAEKKDSQGLCFVGKVDFADFIRNLIPQKRGEIIDSSGKKLGNHDGAHFYTLGQRHGLNIGGSAEPLYVAEKRPQTNTLVVARGGGDPILYRRDLNAGKLNWVSDTPPLPAQCSARIRYRQPLQRCVVDSNGAVVFAAPQKAVSSGQSIVFYSDSGEVLGGGIIR